MPNLFSLYKKLNKSIKTLNEINEFVKITFGPIVKNAIITNKKNDIKIVTSGSILIKKLDFSSKSANTLRKLFE